MSDSDRSTCPVDAPAAAARTEVRRDDQIAERPLAGGGPEVPEWASPHALLAAWAHLQASASARVVDDGEAQAISRDPEAWCALAARALRLNRWPHVRLHPMLVPKRSGGRRLLLVPPLAERVVQGALAHWLQLRIEPLLHDTSHAYRPGRGVASAASAVRSARQAGRAWVWRADIAEFFDRVRHPLVWQSLREAGLTDPALHAAVARALRAEIGPPDGVALPRDMPAALAGHCCLACGLPQGSPLSPALSNLVLHGFDLALSHLPCTAVRYADDIVLLAESPAMLDQAVAGALAALAERNLEVRTDKCSRHVPGEPFEFLGLHFDLGHAQAPDVQSPVTRAHGATLPASHQASAARETQEGPEGQDPERGVGPHGLAAPLLRTLYLLEDGTQLSRQADTLLVNRTGAATVQVPSARLSQVLAFGSTSVSSGAIALCLERAIPVMLLSGRGRHFGFIDPIRPPQLELLRGQLAAMADPARSLAVARTLVKAKLANSLLLLRRWQRRRVSPALAEAVQRLADARHRVAHMDSLAALRGLEGSAAAAAFAALGSLLDPKWRFAGRHRQPPPDPVNSMLSYGYTLLYYNTLTLVLGRGLQPHLGLYHQPRAGHHALVSDLMEPFRPLVVDAIVADLVQNGGVRPGQFNVPEREGEACLMSPEARNRLIDAFERKMNTRVDCPALGMKLDVRRLIDLQALQLAEVLQGRLPHFEAWVAR